MQIRKDHGRIAAATDSIYISETTNNIFKALVCQRSTQTGRWAMLKFKRLLIGQKFTWIPDCSGSVKFFETDYEATHTIRRWKFELLRFDFTIVHRPGRMLTACNILSRYNTWTNEWRKEEASSKWTN